MSPDVTTDDPDPTTEVGAATPSRPSLGPLIALGLSVVVVIVAVGVGIVGGDDVSATVVRVNSTEVSQKTFNRQLGELAPAMIDQGAPADTVTDAFVPIGTAVQLAQVYITNELLRGHVDVSDADRKQFASANREALAPFSPALRSQVVDLNLMQNALVADRGDAGAARFVRRLARTADVKVDPRYGFWNRALAQVCPPTGCTSAAGAR